MWTDRDQTLDITHNPEELWFPGIFGRPVAKPPAITKWENSPKLYQVTDKTFPRTKASAVLSDLGIIALENARAAVRQRQTFRATNKAEMGHHLLSSSTRTASTPFSQPLSATGRHLARIRDELARNQRKKGKKERPTKTTTMTMHPSLISGKPPPV